LKLRQQGVGSTDDLLKQIEGIDGRVTQGVRLRTAARIAAAISTAFAVAAPLLSHYVRDHPLDETFGEAPFLIALGAVVVSAVALSQARQWIRDARQPFRYTYSVDRFKPISIPQDQKLNWARDWIRADLILMLNERIRRLSLLPQEKVLGDTPDDPASHIHISGTYGSRKRPADGRDGPAGDSARQKVTIELMPRVRIGSDACPAAVAYAVRFEADELPDLKEDRVRYDHILERVYFSVSTQIYRQIRRDVDRKIARLPTTYLRATAYFHEGDDYARSNTLDAFSDAGELYVKALDLYDRTRVSLPKWPAVRRPHKWLWRSIFPVWRRVARWLANIAPQFGRRDVQITRAETGYAKVLLFRNILASLSGRQPKRLFEARRYAREAVKRLEAVPEGVPGHRDACFEAHLVAAFAEHWSGDLDAAKQELDAARDLRPATAEDDELFTFVAAGMEPRLHRKVRLLRRAVELRPRFEIAHFELAFNQEQLWRSSDDLDETGANQVKAAYRTVTTLFPANLSAWANLGYVRWLLWDARRQDGATEVMAAFEGGLRYKEIREESFVAELDYGLARVFAEVGRFDRAYEHYVSASQATMAQEVAGGTVDYWFDRVNDAILDRFWRYKRNVERELDAQAREGRAPADWLRNAVRAFVLTDWGNACAAYYRRSGDMTCRDDAFRAFEEAIELNPRYVPARRCSATLRFWTEQDLDRAATDLVEARRAEPRWLPAQLELVRTRVALAEAGDRAAGLVAAARDAANELLAALPKSTNGNSLTGKEVDPALTIKRAGSKRRRAELLEMITGPVADALVAWVQARALEADAKVQQAAARVCEYVQAELLPANRTMLTLATTLGQTPETLTPKLQQLDRSIVKMKLENDPAHAYWLHELLKLKDMDNDTSLDLLRLAARCPGAAPEVLETVADELEHRDRETSVEARARAMSRKGQLEGRRRARLARLAEEHLEDGTFGDLVFTLELLSLVKALFTSSGKRGAVEVPHDVPAVAFPLAYLLAAHQLECDAQRILLAVADQESEGRAATAVRALARLDERRPCAPERKRLRTILAKRAPVVKTLQQSLRDDEPEFLKTLLERVVAAKERAKASANV
jgi:tetratricopeptide (TPR) repeat protein